MTEDWRKNAQQTEQASQEGVTAEIVEIEKTTAIEIFGEEHVGGKNQSNPDRKFILVHLEDETGEEFSEPFSLPKSPRSWKNRNFKLGRFKRTYDKLPEKSMTVEAELDDSGQLAIKMR